MSSEEDFQCKCLTWYREAYRAIDKAGGDPSSVLDRFPIRTLETLIRNNLYLIHAKDIQDEF